MAELVIPVARRELIFRLIVCGGFAVGGLAMAIGGLGMTFAATMMFGVLGGLCAVVFGYVALQDLSFVRSIGLRLTDEHVEFGRYCWAWADIEDLEPVGRRLGGVGSHIRVVPWSGVGSDGPTGLSAALGRIGLYSGPGYIPVGIFDTAGKPLAAILDERLRSYREGTASDAAMGRAARTWDADYVPLAELVIPLRQQQIVKNTTLAAAAAAWFVVLAGGIPLLLLDAENPDAWLCVFVLIVWLITAPPFGYVAYRSVRDIRSPRFRLHDKGIEFGEARWAWSDIGSVDTVQSAEGIRLQPRLHADIRAAPTNEIDPSMFETGDRRLGPILREWWQRYRDT